MTVSLISFVPSSLNVKYPSWTPSSPTRYAKSIPTISGWITTKCCNFLCKESRCFAATSRSTSGKTSAMAFSAICFTSAVWLVELKSRCAISLICAVMARRVDIYCTAVVNSSNKAATTKTTMLRIFACRDVFI